MSTDPSAPQTGSNLVEHLKAWWPAHASVVIAVGYALLPYAQKFVAAHPYVAAAVAVVGNIATLLKQSPVKAVSP
jgi:hypothetical protein